MAHQAHDMEQYLGSIALESIFLTGLPDFQDYTTPRWTAQHMTQDTLVRLTEAAIRTDA